MAAPATTIVEVADQYCKGCGLCVAFCEREVLQLTVNPNPRGVQTARVAAVENCRGCCRCALVCPEGALRIYRP